MAARRLPVTALLCFAAVAGCGADSAVLARYSEEEDARVARLASAKVTELCATQTLQRLEDVDRNSAEDAVMNMVGGSSFLRDILVKANSTAELRGLVREEISVPWAVTVAAPLVLSIVLLVLWLLFCWTTWPCTCCRCCRLCSKRRYVPGYAKCVLLSLVFALVVAVCGTGGYAYTGYRRASSGISNFMCSSAVMLNTTLSGSERDSFIGMVPMMDFLWQMDQNLADGSELVVRAHEIFDLTREIDNAVGMASSTLTLLKVVMELEPNRNLSSQVGAELYHVNQLSETVPGMLEVVIERFENSLATSLADLRRELQEQLGPSKRQELQNSFRESAAPVMETTRTVRDTFKSVLERSEVSMVKQQLSGPLAKAGTAFIILVAILVVACSITSMACCIHNDKRTASIQDRAFMNQHENPYRKISHRCACSSWCFSSWYAIVVFFVGGLLTVVLVVSNNICFMLTTLSGASLRQIGPALGMNQTLGANQAIMLANIIDGCIAGTSNAPNFMDILYYGDSTTTMRVWLENQTITPIKSQLNRVLDRMDSNFTTLADHPDVEKLRKVFRDNSVDSLIIPNASELLQDARFEALVWDERGQDNHALGVQIAGQTSLSCDDKEITVEGSDPIMTFGIETFVSRLEYYGQAQAGSPHLACAESVQCGAPDTYACRDPAQTPRQCATCLAGNEYIDLKRSISLLQRFRCDLFEDPVATGDTCDPLSMEWVAAEGRWGCGREVDGALVSTSKPRNCNLTEFVSYLHDWDGRIHRAMEVVDETVPHVVEQITVQLRGLVEESLVEPVEAFMDSTACGFMGGIYSDLTDSLCLQCIWGLWEINASYTACAVLVLLMAGIAYLVFRYTVDNVNAWRPPPIAKE